MTEYYKEKLNEGLEYQDFISDELLKIGLSVYQYRSKKYQYKVGETKEGIEVKFDKRFAETGNLYIETHEKAHPSRPTYVESGILRNDNTWLYCIGNYNIAFLFGKKHLLSAHRSKKFRMVQTPTSKGFLLPIADAHNFAVFVLKMHHPSPANFV